jgi:hypothetical protein
MPGFANLEVMRVILGLRSSGSGREWKAQRNGHSRFQLPEHAD